MAKTNLGKVCLTPKGPYDQNAAYVSLDAISHNGSSYIVLKPFKGIEPSQNNENVMVLAERGRTAYETALLAGYEGTEEDFELEVSSLAANASRLTDLEKNKADIDAEGYILREQINPYTYLVQGVNTSEGYLRNTNPLLLFSGPRTVEILFRLSDNTSSIGYVYSQQHGHITSMHIRCGEERLRFYVGNTEYSIEAEKSRLYHVVMSYRGAESEVVVNGVSLGVKQVVLYTTPDELKIGRRDTEAGQSDTWGTFQGIVYRTRIFSYGMTFAGMYQLWNSGDPTGYSISNSSYRGRSYELYKTTGLSDWKVYAGTDEHPIMEDDAIKCTFPKSANSYANGVYYRFNEPLPQNAKLILRFKAKSSEPNGCRITTGFGASMDNLPGAEFGLRLTNEYQQFEIERTNSFTKLLQQVQFYPFYSQVQEGSFYVKDVEVILVGCVAEYRSEGIRETHWIDTAGNGCDLPVENGNISYELLYPAYTKVIFGEQAPGVKPEFGGQEYIDTINKSIYKAIGNSSAEDWLLIS